MAGYSKHLSPFSKSNIPEFTYSIGVLGAETVHIVASVDNEVGPFGIQHSLHHLKGIDVSCALHLNRQTRLRC